MIGDTPGVVSLPFSGAFGLVQLQQYETQEQEEQYATTIKPDTKMVSYQNPPHSDKDITAVPLVTTNLPSRSLLKI